MLKRIVFVFDLDETLIGYNKQDRAKEEKNYYMRLNPTKKYKEMIRLFKFLYITKQKVLILTSRHPKVAKLIARYLNFPEKNIICRNYALDRKEYSRVPYSKVALGKFMKEMVRHKLKTLNRLTADYGHIIFYDDNANKYIHNKLLSPKVSVFYPIHLQSKKYSKN